MGNSHDRRFIKRHPIASESTPIPVVVVNAQSKEPVERYSHSDKLAIALALIGFAVAIALLLVGILLDRPITVFLLLALMAVVLIYPVIQFVKTTGWRVATFLGLAFVIAISTAVRRSQKQPIVPDVTAHNTPTQPAPIPTESVPPPTPVLTLPIQPAPTAKRNAIKEKGRDAKRAPTPVDAARTKVQTLDPNDPNYEYLKRGCLPPQPGTKFYFCKGEGNDIHDNQVNGAFQGSAPAFDFEKMKDNKIWNNTVNVAGTITSEDLKVLDDLKAQYMKDHQSSALDQPFVDWINAQLKERGKQFQIHPTPPSEKQQENPQ